MSRSVNPFPAYPVATSGGLGTEADRLTVMTPGVARAEMQIDRYAAQLGAGAEGPGLIVPVVGQFGAGKTHLLGHVAQYLRSQSPTRERAAGIVSVSAMESTPEDWYRTAVGPRVAALDLEQLATEFLAEVAKAVALRTPLTEAAAAHIANDPASVRALIEGDLLNSTSIEVETIAALERIAPTTGPQVLTALEGLIWQPRPALRWLEGERLSERETIQTGLPEALESPAQAADAIAAIAAMHRFVGRPFLLLIDELEHLTRLDERTGGKSNITWLKRLLERLERGGACVFVAGHPSAWEGQPDFLERFSPGERIELTALTAEQVLEIVEQFEGDTGSFSADDATLVREAAEGNIRRVLEILHALHESTEGFETPPSRETVATAMASPPRVDPEQAIAALAGLFAELGLQVSRRSVIGDLSFDLVAYRGEEPAVVVEAKHAHFGKRQQEQTQRFIDKLRIVNRTVPRCIGVFASEGSLDSGLLEIDPSAARVLWFDITRQNLVEEARAALEPLLDEDLAVERKAPERDVVLADLVDEIQAVKDLQATGYSRLEERLKAPPARSSGLEYRPPSAAETRDERRVIFEDLAKRPSPLRQFGLVPGMQILAASIVLVLGLGLILQAGLIADALVSYSEAPETETETLYRSLLWLVGASAILSSLAFGARQFQRLDRFYRFKEERLRDVYVLDLPVSALLDTNRIIDQALDREGLRYGIAEATRVLDDAGLLQDYAQMSHG